MPNTREKLIAMLDRATKTFRFDAWENTDKIAHYLIANGVTIPTLCEHCQLSDTISCPAGRVWCGRMMRYMKLDGFCSEGKEKEA